MHRTISRNVTVHLIRHAESTTNIHGNIIGGVDALLTERGHRQCAALNAFLIEHPLLLDGLYSSTMPRARLTTHGIRAGTKFLIDPLTDKDPVIYDHRLREIDRGDWERQPRDTTITQAVQDEMTFLDMHHRAPNGESMHDVAGRMLQWLHELAARTERDGGSTFGVVSHGIAIKSLLQGLFGFHPSLAWRISIWNTSITTVRSIPNAGWELIRLNAVPHQAPW